MRNYQFQLSLPVDLLSRGNNNFTDFAVQQDRLQHLFNAHHEVAEYITSNATGVPTYSGIGPASQVYQNTKIKKVIAAEAISAGNALNLYYANDELRARKAVSTQLTHYCNALAVTAAAPGSLVSFYENQGYSARKFNSNLTPCCSVYLSKIPGTFTNVMAQGVLAQLCGFTDSVGDFYFTYNNPVALFTEVFTNDNNQY